MHPADTPTGVQSVAELFARAWQHDMSPPDLAAFLPADAAGRLRTLRELIPLDIDFRRRAGQAVSLKDYVTRFPELDADAPGEPRTADTASYVTDADDRPPTAVQPPPPSTTLTVLGELGRGGMGIVYKARDRRGQIVALKRLPRLDAGSLARFKQEFRALADLVHPNLVKLYEFTFDGALCYFTMELVEGLPFAQYIRGDAFSLEDPARRLARLRDALGQLAAGVAALHAAGKLHRDLKPSNVLVTPAGRVVILDFGLAAELDPEGRHLSTEYHVVGTAAYMAPEQAAGTTVSPASDWYSVGVMLFEALTGRLPFTGTMLQIMQERQKAVPMPPRAFADDVPDDLNDLCTILMRLTPAERLPGAELLTRGASTASVSSAETMFVGRDVERRAILDAFEAVAAHEPRTVLVHGVSGVGKTALAQWIVDEVRARRGAVVLTGRCYQGEAVPFKAFDSLIDNLATYLRRLPPAEASALMPRDAAVLAGVFPVLGRVPAVAMAPRRAGGLPDPHELRRRAFAALRDLLARLGDRAPLVLVIDDLQWGDIDSAERLAALVRPPDAPVMLLLGTYRSEDVETSPCLKVLRSDLCDGVDHCHVEPLPPEIAVELARQLLAPTDDTRTDLADAVARESAGNPYFAHELARHLRREPPDGQLPERGSLSLDDVLAARAAMLSPEARRLLEVVAIAGRPTDRTVAALAAELIHDAPALKELRVGRFLTTRSDGRRELVEAYHDRLRQAVIGGVGPAAQRDYHQRLYTALTAANADPEARAAHAEGSGDVLCAAHLYADAAARAGAALAFYRAARLYRRALDLGHWPDRVRAELRRCLAESLVNQGRAAEAAREYLQAAEGMAPLEALDCRRRATTQLLAAGHIDEGIEVLRRVLATVGLHLPDSSRAAVASFLWRRLLLRLRGTRFRPRDEESIAPDILQRIDVCCTASVGLATTDPIRGAAFQARHVWLALRAGDPFRVARALAIEAGFAAATGPKGARRAARLLDEAEQLAVGRPHAAGMVHLGRGAVAYLSGDWERAARYCSAADQLLREHCVGTLWELKAAREFQLFALYFQGRIGELAERLPSVIGEARDRGNIFAVDSFHAFFAPLVHLANDEPDAAWEALDAVARRWSEQNHRVQHYHAFQNALLIDLYAGRPGAAHDRLQGKRTDRGPAAMHALTLFRCIARENEARSMLAAAAAGIEPAGNLRRVGRMAKALAAERVRYADGWSQLLRAGVHAAQRHPCAADSYRKATDDLWSADLGLYAAAARRRLGQLTDGAAGRDLIAAADEWMTSQGVKNPVRMTAMLAPGVPDEPTH